MIIQQSYLKVGHKPQRVFELGLIVRSMEAGTRPLIGQWVNVKTIEASNQKYTIEAKNT